MYSDSALVSEPLVVDPEDGSCPANPGRGSPDDNPPPWKGPSRPAVEQARPPRDRSARGRLALPRRRMGRRVVPCDSRRHRVGRRLERVVDARHRRAVAARARPIRGHAPRGRTAAARETGPLGEWPPIVLGRVRSATADRRRGAPRGTCDVQDAILRQRESHAPGGEGRGAGSPICRYIPVSPSLLSPGVASRPTFLYTDEHVSYQRTCRRI